jgi:hypothetical protein
MPQIHLCAVGSVKCTIACMRRSHRYLISNVWKFVVLKIPIIGSFLSRGWPPNEQTYDDRDGGDDAVADLRFRLGKFGADDLHQRRYAEPDKETEEERKPRNAKRPHLRLTKIEPFQFCCVGSRRHLHLLPFWPAAGLVAELAATLPTVEPLETLKSTLQA